MEEQKVYCRYLRGKNAYGTLEGGGHPFVLVDPGTTTYWCIATMGPVGPDGRPAHLSVCGNEKRQCYRRPEEEE